MVIDSSAIIAVLRQEPEARVFADAIASDRIRLVSAVSALESAMVMESRYGPSGAPELDAFLSTANIEIVPLNAEQFELGRSAWRRFGKGRHAAALNLGDCCSYALSAVSGEQLLAKGDDFRKTDARLVGWSLSH